MAIRGISRPVWLLGWTSLFTDAATEMIYPLLPVFLSGVLGAGATSLGIVEGVAEGVNSLLKIVSGRLSDRRSRRRPIVIAGYALSSAARPLIALTSTWPQVMVIRALDRTGKGIRGAPRDALLAQFATPSTRGLVYGFHQAMDHIGAIVGPLIATVILYFAPGNYRLVFGVTAIPGAMAVALLFLVNEDAEPVPGKADLPASATVGSLPTRNAVLAGPSARRTDPAGKQVRAAPTRDPAGAIHDSPALPRPLFAFLGVLLVFSLGNSADAFLLLRLADALGGATWVPLLWAALHVVKASLSVWGGALSDRLGRKRMIAFGWAIYAVVYLGFALSHSAVAFIAWFLLYGAYFGFSEGAEKALIADFTPASRRGAAFGYYNAVLGVGALVASLLFGFLYDRFGATAAFGTGAALAAVASLLLSALPRPEARPQ